MGKNSMVSVAMITYNHGKYIAKALDSVLTQVVNFKYEVIIGDDCSSDNTQSIIREYVEKYPDIIRPILRTKNIGGMKNANDIRSSCKGKYSIFLEGDDYWTDENKLQEQFDFLEDNTEYIAVSHWSEVVDEKGNITKNFPNKYEIFNFENEIYSIEDFKKGRVPGHTTTLMYRNIYSNPKYDYLKIFSASDMIGDRTAYMILSLQGNIYCIHKIMSHYRYVSKVGGSSFSSQIKNKNTSYMIFSYYKKLEEYTRTVMDNNISLKQLKYEYFLSALSMSVKNPNKENIENLCNIFKDSNEKILMIGYCPIGVIRRLLKRIKVQ